MAFNSDWLDRRDGRDGGGGRSVAGRHCCRRETTGVKFSSPSRWTAPSSTSNNGYTCPSPRVVHEALKRYLDIVEPGADLLHVEHCSSPTSSRCGASSRSKPAAIRKSWRSRATRARRCRSCSSASTCKPGDEVVTTNQDYGRMLDTWDQRVRRDKIKVTKISFPVPTTNLGRPDRAHQRAITPRTKVIHICHITNLTGPALSRSATSRAMARARGIQTIVDGAHAFAHFPFKRSRSRVRLLRHARCTSGCWRRSAPASLRAAREHREGLAADAGRGEPRSSNIREVRGDRARIRRRTTTRSPKRCAFHQAIGVERKAGAAALPERSLGDAASRSCPRVKILHRAACRIRPGVSPTSASQGVDVAEGLRLPVGHVADHHRVRSGTRNTQGLRITEHLHHAPRSRHVQGRDRGRC